MPNHKSKMATSILKGMAAKKPSTHRIMLIRKKSANKILRESERKGLGEGRTLNISQEQWTTTGTITSIKLRHV